MKAFNFHKPKTLDKALNLFKENENAKYLAGGQSLLPLMKQNLAQYTDLISLSGIDDLRGISQNDKTPKQKTFFIGGMTTHAEVESSSYVRQNLPVLSALANEIGDPHVRHRGTLGGSIANNDPASDYPAACLALEAIIHTNNRDIPAESFFTGLFSTILDDDEIVLSVEFPITQFAAYMRFPKPALRYPIVGVMVAKPHSMINVAVTGAASCVFRETALEQVLNKKFSPSIIDKSPLVNIELLSDIHASREYRAHLIKVMTKRAIEKLS